MSLQAQPVNGDAKVLSVVLSALGWSPEDDDTGGTVACPIVTSAGRSSLLARRHFVLFNVHNSRVRCEEKGQERTRGKDGAEEVLWWVCCVTQYIRIR